MQVQPHWQHWSASLPGSQYTAIRLDGEAIVVTARVDDAITITLPVALADDHVPVAVSLSGVNHFAALSNRVKIDSKRI